MRDKVYLIFDKTKASLKIKSILIKKIKITSLIKSNIIIVLGGDGFMLQTLKKLHKYKKPFYGINSGNYGFLMNKFSNENIIKNLNISNSIKIYFIIYFFYLSRQIKHILDLDWLYQPILLTIIIMILLLNIKANIKS